MAAAAADQRRQLIAGDGTRGDDKTMEGGRVYMQRPGEGSERKHCEGGRKENRVRHEHDSDPLRYARHGRFRLLLGSGSEAQRDIQSTCLLIPCHSCGCSFHLTSA
jgi:hypothetical protein